MSIYLITLLNVLNSVALRGSRVLMSLFAIQLGSGAFEIGMLIAVSLVFQLFLGIYAGKVSDRYGFRLPILFGSLGSGLAMIVPRSEEHTSELQSQSNLVCRLLLE